MKTMQSVLLLLAFAGGLAAQPLPTNPPATNFKPAAVATNGIVPLTDVASPATPGRTVRSMTAGPGTNTNTTTEFPAFPAFPTPPPSRRAAAAAAAAAANAANFPNATPPGNVATPIDPAASAAAAAGNVAGKKPAATAGGVTTGAASASRLDDEEIIPAGIIKFQDADLLQVLDIYQDLTGRTIVRPNSLPATKISVRSQTSLTRREAVQLLDTILAMNQITMLPQGDKFVKAVPQAQAGTEAPIFTDPDAPLSETTHYITKIVRLKNALPRDVAPLLQPLAKMPASIFPIDSSSLIVLRDYEENIKRMEELLQEIDVVAMNEYEPIVIPIKYALASDIAQVLSSLTAGGGGATTVGGSRTATGLSSSPGIQKSQPSARPAWTTITFRARR